MRKVIKFTAEWCPSCVSLDEKLKDIVSDVPIINLDYDENTKVFGQYKVREVPTMIMYEGDTEVKKITGSNFTQEQLTEWLNS